MGDELLGQQGGNIMDKESVRKIIDENEVLLNIGGHYFEGLTKHNRKTQGLPQLPDLLPFEMEGRIRRIRGGDGIGKSYIDRFVSTKIIEYHEPSTDK